MNSLNQPNTKYQIRINSIDNTLACFGTIYHLKEHSVLTVYIAQTCSLLWTSINKLSATYLSSSNQCLMHHLSYNKLHCLTSIPMCFSARRCHPQGVNC